MIRSADEIEPVWKPCFICQEKVEVPDFSDAEYLLVVCGPCRKKAYDWADKEWPLVEK